MSDQKIRELERQLKADPTDLETARRLFSEKKRGGSVVESSYKIKNSKGLYLTRLGYDYSNYRSGGYQKQPIWGKGGKEFKTMATVKSYLKKILEINNKENYSIVEFQTIAAGEISSEVMEQILKEEKERKEAAARERRKRQLKKEIAEKQKELTELASKLAKAEGSKILPS